MSVTHRVETTWQDSEGDVHRLVLDVHDEVHARKLRSQRAPTYLRGKQTACGQEIEVGTGHVDPKGTPTCALPGCDGEPPRHPLAPFRLGDPGRAQAPYQRRLPAVGRGVA